jgi:hypothetical protein
MPRVAFEPMTLVFDRVKTVHALDHAATMIGMMYENMIPLLCSRTVATKAVRDSLYRSTAMINLMRHRTEQWLPI